eukprot:2020661-Prymnesium_polylepis.2
MAWPGLARCDRAGPPIPACAVSAPIISKTARIISRCTIELTSPPRAASRSLCATSSADPFA